MKSILKTVAASVALVGLTAMAAPAFAGPGHVEFRVDSGYRPPPVYVEPRVVYDGYRYRDDRAWREHAWRERERRERYWRQREWREHEWSERHAWEHRGDVGRGYGRDWR